MEIQYDIMHSHKVKTHAYSSNLTHQWFIGKVICGRLDAITLSILALLISNSSHCYNRQQRSCITIYTSYFL